MGKASSIMYKYLNTKRNFIVSWIKSHKKEIILLGLILLVASFLRLYRIADYMTFLGDEGRDVIIVRRFVTQGDIMLIGPGTSIGNMYLGPLYYYFIAPALLFSFFSPVGPAVLVALLSIVTVWFIWFCTREWFGKSAGLVAALCYAIAPTVIVYSRSSWNPNIMPFFALVSMYGIWRVWKYQQVKWLPVIGIAFAFCLQSHYLALLLTPVLGFFWILAAFSARGKMRKSFLIYSLAMIVLFALLMSPLLIFDARHGYRNFNSIKLFFTERQTTVSIRPWNALPLLYPQLLKVSTRLLSGYDQILGQWIAVGILGTTLVLVKGKRFFLNIQSRSALFLLLVWLLTALGGLALYKQEIYDHYYGFFFPVPFILVGAVLGTIFDRYKIRGGWLAGTALLLIVWVNLNASPIRLSPNQQLRRSVTVTEFIRNEAKGQPFNFAVIAERNYEGAYRYFFDRATDPVKDIDPQNTADTITDQLFVVCEMPKEKCDPTHNAKAEVANFGWSKVDQEWEVFGTTVYKLVHSQ